MPDRNADQSKGENDKNNNNRAPSPPAPPSPPDRTRGGNKIYKSGPLFLSSRGIGWTSWKKRWFILTRTSLVFFRTDPSIIPPKGSEVNLTLGGIDLNSSGSVVIKADKKLLTVLFPDGRDGRAFTLKAETSEDLYDWKDALEEALANAPTATLLTGQNGIFRNDQAEVADVFMEQTKERQPVKSLVIGRPILLALEDIDGTPSFLEKALRFIEVHGLKVEGILRQAADVDDVEHRIREYEQGKNEFFPEEDPHVIADCVKYVLRELPSSPVPASCCNALLDAFRTDRGMRVAAMRTAICETFPEPNRRLLQRILEMMQTVASHKSLNRMSTSAVAACMAPLLLRPLLAGDCELENDVDLGDGSVQLLQAAAAANHAQAIIITLLEEYDTFFGEGGSISPGIYSDTEESGSEFTDDDDDDTFEDGDDDDESEGSDADVDEDFEHTSSGTCSETGDNLYGQKGSEKSSSVSTSSELSDHLEDNHKLSSNPQQTSPTQHNSVEESGLKMKENKSGELLEGDTVERSLILKNPRDFRRSTPWGRTPAKKNMESVDFSSGDEDAIQRLEAAKIDLQNKISEEAKGNALLQEDLGKRKSVLHERRLALEQDVARLQEELQKEKELRAILEAGLKMSQGLSSVSAIDEKMKGKLEEIAQVEADVMNLKLKADDLGMQLNQHLHDQNHGLLNTSSNQPQQSQTKDKQKDSETTSTPKMPTRSKGQLDVHLDKLECEKDAKEEALPSQNKHVSTSVEPEVSGKPVLTNSKRTAEGANSTPSTLSKLTNRLDFLKERRSQITNELQNFEKGQNLSQSFEKIRGGFVSMQMDYGFQQSIPESQLVSLGKNNGSISQPLTYDNNIPIKRLVAAATATNAAKSENNQDFEQDRCVFPRKK